MWDQAAYCSETHKQAGWWKGNFALFHMLATGEEGGEGKYLSKGQLQLWQPVGQGLFFFFFKERRKGLPAKTEQSALTVIFKLAIGGLTSVILVVLGTVNTFSFRVHLFPFL